MGGEKKEKPYSIQTDFSLLAILIIPVAVAVNFVAGQLALLLKLPLYLDTIGTIFVSMLCGPWVGALAGGLTNIINGIANPVNLAFIPVNVIVGLVTGFLARGNMFSVWWKWLVSIILMTLASIISAAPIVVLMFGGVTGSGTSFVAAALMTTGTNIWIAVIGSDGFFTVIDRIISYFISWFVIRVIPNKTLIKFGCGGNYIKKKTAPVRFKDD
ncbi:MAG: ECF transporter S component [Spirochaetaceae bacterium]|jgi:energy-coupling factor transport system substrate-specific component|nr:ECF transporter S component [Spirochaetaceae bacterium]